MGLGRGRRDRWVPGEEPWDRCAATAAGAGWASPTERTDQMAGIESNTPGFLPYDNAALRARLAELPLRTTSIEAELRAVMAERRAMEAAAAPKRGSRWS